MPKGWQLRSSGGSNAAAGFDGLVTITAPDRRTARLAVEGKSRVSPRQVLLIASLAKRAGEIPVLVVSPFLSKATRERLMDERLNWLDLTGNVRLVINRPGLFIETQGANRQTGAGRGPARTLKGLTAGRVVRAVLVASLPTGVTELAERSGTDPGYTSRVLELLATEALIERKPRGPVTTVDRLRLVRRWAEDAPVTARGNTGLFLEPRGIGALVGRLRNTRIRYAITGSLAAQQWAPIAAPRLVQVYVEDSVAKGADELGLRPAEGGANVQLICPKDPNIIESRRKAPDGVYYARPLQVAVDLLTSPGRAPAEGEELLSWMSGRANAWE